MTTPHTITEEELGDYIQIQRQRWSTFAVSSDASSIKKLEFCLGDVAPLYRVTSHGRDIYIGVLSATAVREYNALSNGEL